MANLVLDSELGRNSGGITTSNDSGGSVLRGLNEGVKNTLGTLGEGVELKDTGRTIQN